MENNYFSYCKMLEKNMKPPDEQVKTNKTRHFFS